MTIQFCKTCLQNNVNTRVEWKPHPSGKNKPFDVDKNEWHSPCPYWKPTKKFAVPADVKEAFAKIENDVNQTDLQDLHKKVDRIEELVKAVLLLVQQWPKASQIK